MISSFYFIDKLYSFDAEITITTSISSITEYCPDKSSLLTVSDDYSYIRSVPISLFDYFYSWDFKDGYTAVFNLFLDVDIVYFSDRNCINLSTFFSVVDFNSLPVETYIFRPKEPEFEGFLLIDQAHSSETVGFNIGYGSFDTIDFDSSFGLSQSSVSAYSFNFIDILNLNSIISVDISSVVSIQDYLYISSSHAGETPIFIDDYISLFDNTFSPSESVRSIFDINDLLTVSFDVKISSLIGISDILNLSSQSNYYEKDILTFKDLGRVISDKLKTIFFLLRNVNNARSLTNNILYSMGSDDIDITGIDEIVTASDGIYIFDEERVKGDMIFDFEKLNTSRMLKLDKVFSDTDLVSARVITDEATYTYTGKRWIDCGRGLRGKLLKVVLRDMERAELVSFRLVPLKRAK